MYIFIYSSPDRRSISFSFILLLIVSALSIAMTEAARPALAVSQRFLPRSHAQAIAPIKASPQPVVFTIFPGRTGKCICSPLRSAAYTPSDPNEINTR